MDWLLDMPWSTLTEDGTDLDAVEAGKRLAEGEVAPITHILDEHGDVAP